MTKSVFIFFILIIAIGVTGWALYLKGGGETDMEVLTASESPMPEEETQELNNAAEVMTHEAGFQYQDLQVGDGVEIQSGQSAVVHYTGWLEDGTKFDSSLDRGEPAVFPIGVGAVIKGWDLGVVGMKVGGTRRLTLPPELAYGDRGTGGVIPPGATLVFQIQLLDVLSGDQ